ncbi:MAG: hypothetical protein MHM6MM_003167 [Cercozoa sp. M6MM]
MGLKLRRLCLVLDEVTKAYDDLEPQIVDTADEAVVRLLHSQLHEQGDKLQKMKATVDVLIAKTKKPEETRFLSDEQCDKVRAAAADFEALSERTRRLLDRVDGLAQHLLQADQEEQQQRQQELRRQEQERQKELQRVEEEKRLKEQQRQERLQQQRQEQVELEQREKRRREAEIARYNAEVAPELQKRQQQREQRAECLLRAMRIDMAACIEMVQNALDPSLSDTLLGNVARLVSVIVAEPSDASKRQLRSDNAELQRDVLSVGSNKTEVAPWCGEALLLCLGFRKSEIQEPDVKKGTIRTVEVYSMKEPSLDDVAMVFCVHLTTIF